MTERSLEGHMKKMALGWATGGIALTIGLTISILCWLPFQDSKDQLVAYSKAIVSSHRRDILSGDVRMAELQVRKELQLGDKERAFFLDPNLKPWVQDPKALEIKACVNNSGVCSDFLNRWIVTLTPVYFDTENSSLWGYLYVEKAPPINWPTVMSVVLAVFLGMGFQAVGFYMSVTRAIKAVGAMLSTWAHKLSIDPRRRDEQPAPYTELSPIESALNGLRTEIENLTEVARKEGALAILRSIGHDILNPVSRIKRILGIVRTEDKDGAIDEELLSSLEANAKRLSTYAEQLKYIYKRKTGEEIGTNVTDASEELEALTKELAFDPSVTERKISIESEIENNCIVPIAPAAIGRLVENLFSNSIYASKRNSTVKIAVRTNGDRVVISVSDSGHGIDPKIINRIFEPEFTSRPNQGTGLGLFVVKQICEQYGGKINIDSQVERGTTISVDLPRVELKNELQNFVG